MHQQQPSTVPFWSPDVWLGLEMLRDIQFELPCSYFKQLTIITRALTFGSGRGNPKIFGCALCTRSWTPLSKFLDPPLAIIWVPCEQPRDRYSKTKFATCGCEEKIAGHVPRELSRKVYHFLRHGGRATCEVIRWKGGKGLEVPYMYVPLSSKAIGYKEARSFASVPCGNAMIIPT